MLTVSAICVRSNSSAQVERIPVFHPYGISVFQRITRNQPVSRPSLCSEFLALKHVHAMIIFLFSFAGNIVAACRLSCVLEQKEQSYDLFAIRRTICQMLLDRSYSLPPEDR